MFVTHTGGIGLYIIVGLRGFVCTKGWLEHVCQVQLFDKTVPETDTRKRFEYAFLLRYSAIKKFLID